jgi:hypothetical protein
MALARRSRSFDREAGWPILRRRILVTALIVMGVSLIVFGISVGDRLLLSQGVYLDAVDRHLSPDQLTGLAFASAAVLLVSAYKFANPRTRALGTVVRVWLWRFAALLIVLLAWAVFAGAVYGLQNLWGQHDLKKLPEHASLLAGGIFIAAGWAAWRGSMWCWSLSTQVGLAREKDVRRTDLRRPVVLLRSFGDDQQLVQFDKTDEYGWQRLEEAIRPWLSRFGPFIAISEPGQLPEFGAARATFSNETWQSAVIDWMREARVIVVVAGETDALRWEISQVVAGGHIRKLLIIMPPSRDLARRWARVCSCFEGTAWHAPVLALQISRAKAIYFGADGPVAIQTKFEQMRDYGTAIELALYGILWRG